VAALTRRVIVVYLQGAALYAIYFMGFVAVSQTRSLKPFWPAVFDPIGLLLSGSVGALLDGRGTQHALDAAHGHVLWNRVVWGSVGLIALGLYSFSSRCRQRR
jgi:ABC-2 type transport system permease protein